jgi:hypothetical protein
LERGLERLIQHQRDLYQQVRTGSCKPHKVPENLCCGEILARIRIRRSVPLTNPDPDPVIFVLDLQDANKKTVFVLSFSAYYFLQDIYIIFER